MRGSNNFNNNINHSNNNNIRNRSSIASVANKAAMISLPRGTRDMEEVAGAQDTIYLCNFRVSVDGEWLCLKELQDLDIQEDNNTNTNEAGALANFGSANIKCDDKLDRDWVNYCRWLHLKSSDFMNFLLFLCVSDNFMSFCLLYIGHFDFIHTHA